MPPLQAKSKAVNNTGRQNSPLKAVPIAFATDAKSWEDAESPKPVRPDIAVLIEFKAVDAKGRNAWKADEPEVGRDPECLVAEGIVVKPSMVTPSTLHAVLKKQAGNDTDTVVDAL